MPKFTVGRDGVFGGRFLKTAVAQRWWSYFGLRFEKSTNVFLHDALASTASVKAATELAKLLWKNCLFW